MNERGPLPLEYAPVSERSPFERMPKWLQSGVFLVIFACVIAVMAAGAVLVFWFVRSIL
jgi:hypothetical protein